METAKMIYDKTSVQTKIMIIGVFCLMIGLIWFYKKNQPSLPPSTGLYMREIEWNEPVNGTLLYRDPMNQTGYHMNAPYISPMNDSLGSFIQNNMYSYGIWVKIDPSNYKSGNSVWRHIFSRGDIPRGSSETGVNPDTTLCNPGLFLHPTTNNLRVHISTITNPARVELEDISLNQWIHVVIVTEYTQVSVYLNGRFVSSTYIQDAIKDTVNMNHYVNYVGGFIGNDAYLSISPLVYTQDQITALYEYGKEVIQKYETYLLENTKVLTPDIIETCPDC